MINKQTIDRIFDALIIEDIVGEFVHLKKAGAKVSFTTILGNDKLKNFVIDEMKKSKIKLIIKGRAFVINSYFEGFVRFSFNDLCKYNILFWKFLILFNISFRFANRWVAVNSPKTFVTLFSQLNVTIVELPKSLA